jgi:hypothetical protein
MPFMLKSLFRLHWDERALWGQRARACGRADLLAGSVARRRGPGGARCALLELGEALRDAHLRHISYAQCAGAPVQPSTLSTGKPCVRLQCRSMRGCS